MLTYSQDGRRGEPLYEYYYKCIRADIEDGSLKAGTKLPSKRSFAEHNGISVITVEGTYGQLAAEGYIYSEAKRGFFVADINVKKPVGLAGADHEIRSVSEDYSYNLASQSTPAEQFPFATWTRLMRRRIADEQEAMLKPSPSGGIYELRQAIAEHLHAFRGITVAPEQIIIGAGTEYLYSLIVSLLGRDRLIALENPGYSKPGKIYQSLDAETTAVAVDAEGMDIHLLRESHADIAQVSPSHHFPTGAIMPISRRYELLAWANEAENHYILEDDYDSELRLSGKPIPALFSIDLSGKVIYLNTFTKTLTPTIRISYMVLPENLMERYVRQLGYYSCTVSNFEQYTLAAFIKEGYFEKHLNRMRVHYREIRDALIAELDRVFPAGGYQIPEKEAGLHFLLEVNTGYSDSEIKRRAIEHKVKLSFLSDYGSERQGTLVVCYSSLNKENIAELAEVLNTLLYS